MGHGIFISATGDNPAKVDVKFNISNTGPGDAVLDTSENGLNALYLDNTSASNPVVTQNGTGDGVHLIATGNTLVSSAAASGQTSQGVFLQTDAGTEIKANTGNAITATYTGTGGGAGTGADVVTVIANGALGDGANVLGGDGVNAAITGGGAGNVNVTVSSIHATLAGVVAQTNGTGNVTVVTDPGGSSIVAGGDGIDAAVGKGKATVTNQAGGAITGGGAGVSISGKGVVTNDAGGAITGGTFGVMIAAKGGTVVNAGTISGATASVEFTGSGNNKLTLKTGSILSGDAIGSTAAGATNALAFTGHGTAANNFVNFNTLTVTAGHSRWVLDGVSAIGATTVSSGALQVGDLAHVSAQLSGAVAVSATGTLTGDGTVAGAVNNLGLISATDAGGTLDITGAVSGSGSVTIAAGTLRFGSAFSQNVTFTGTTGVLDLANSQGYGGTITGFSHSGGTQLDLRDIAFVSAGEATFSGTSSSGVLTVSDGTHTAKINLFGDYLASTFVAASDGHGGTLVHDPAATSAQLASPSVH
jgi:hypothetical protein